MRSAILQMPEQRTVVEHNRVLRAAIRQLERAELYLAAVAALDIGDRDLERSLRKLRSDLARLTAELGEKRLRFGE